MAASPSELAALIRLLDDPEETVRQHVWARLEALGASGEAALAEAALSAAVASAAPDARPSVADALTALRAARLEADWRALFAAPSPDLETGAFLLARLGSPALDPTPYRRTLDNFARRAAPVVSSVRGAARALALSQFMCETLGFAGNATAYYAPENSYLDWVIDHRRGIPISLSVVYLLLGQRLGLPVFGVNMPAHFLVKYAEGAHTMFFDLFNGGAPLTQAQSERMLETANIAPEPSFFAATDARTILARMVRNLHGIARHRHQDEAARVLARLLHLAAPVVP